VGRYLEPALVDGKMVKVRRSVILGECKEMSKSRATRALADELRPINEGLHAPASRISFGELWQKWQANVLCNYRSSTRVFYQRTAERWIVPYFKSWPLEDVTPLAVQVFVNRFGGYSKSVLRHIRATLSRILAAAVDWQFAPRNAAANLRLPPGNPVKRAAVLTPREMGQVIDALPEPYRAMAVIESRTGLRESEVLALRWEDFDLLRGVLTVRRSVYRGQVGGVKTEAGAREIPYGATVADALVRLRAAEGFTGGYLFVAPKGGFYAPQRITAKVFKPLAAKLELPAFSWRSFRRSAATVMHLGGVPLRIQQEILGHASADMSLLYTDPRLEDKRAALAKLDGLFDLSCPKSSQIQ
jgi:integrase